MCVFGPIYVCLGQYVFGSMCVWVHLCMHACGSNLHFEESSRIRGEQMSFFYPFCNHLHSFFKLLTLSLENLGVKMVRSVQTGFNKHVIETFDSFDCLESMCRDVFGIHRILMNFLVWLDDIKILDCKWAFSLSAPVLCGTRLPWGHSVRPKLSHF